MDTISHGVGAEVSSEGASSVGFGFIGVSWAKDVPEFLDGVIADELHAGDDV